MAVDEDKKEEGAEEKRPKKDSKVGLLIGIIVVVLIVQLGVAFAVVKLTAPKQETAETEQPTDTSTGGDISNAVVANELLTPNEFTHVVNISGTDGMRFLKVTLQLAYDGDSEANKAFGVEYLKYEARIKNFINQYLASLSLEEVHDKNVQQNIRRDVLRGVNKLFPPNTGELSNVYIAEFIIQ